MSETKQISVLVLITLLIGATTLFLLPKGPISFGGDLVVDNYEAVLFSDGTLIEKYTYDVQNSGQYRMLFRYWDDLLSFEKLDRPYIEFLSVTYPEGTIGYAKDYWGNVKVFGEQSYSYT
ncbi:MAG: DUF2207 domain-containing protein, partial [Candidatus Methanofastidiosa archaeon]|nr:DUF2207 domain-containing protein [Candidatus Methanofastidiosa archaeon]